MEHTQTKRRPGRPKVYCDLVRRLMLVEFDVDQAAVDEAERTGRSVSDVYREWISRGRAG